MGCRNQNGSLRRCRAGFTVVELLVASAVTLILSAVMLIMASNVLRAWHRTSGALNANNQAALVLDVLASDFQQALYRNDGNVWLAASVVTSREELENRHRWAMPSHPKPDEPGKGLVFDEVREFTDTRYGMAGAWLRFFTHDTDQSLPTAVGYQIIRRTVTSNEESEQRYMLYRVEVSSDEVLDVGFDLNPSLEGNGYYDEGATAGTSSTITTPPRDWVIANDAIDFGVRFYRYGNGDLELVFPRDNEDLEYLAGSSHQAFPDVMDVFVRILTSEGVKLLREYEEAPEDFQHPDDWWDIAEEHSHVFTKRMQAVGDF